MRVMIISATNIALYGHIARTGEIFGIREMIIPSLEVVEKEEFKSVSVTAEKWLRICEVGHGGKEDKDKHEDRDKDKDGRREGVRNGSIVSNCADTGQLLITKQQQRQVMQLLLYYKSEGYKLLSITHTHTHKDTHKDIHNDTHNDSPYRVASLPDKFILLLDEQQIIDAAIVRLIDHRVGVW